MIGLDTSMLVGMFVSSILYGVFVVLFIITVYVLLCKARLNAILLAAVISMFILSTAIIAISFSRILDGFVVYRDTLGPILYFEAVSTEWKQLAHMILLLIYSLFADVILIYRCWVIWSRDWRVVAFNLVLWLGTVVTVLIDITLTSRITLGYVGLAAALVVNEYNTAFLALTLSQNIIVTSLIIFRLWRVNAAASPYKQTTLIPIIIIIMESGALYAATLLAYLVTAVVAPLLQSAVTDILSSMIGITFSLVIVRVGLAANKAPAPSTSAEAHPMQYTSTTTGRPFTSDGAVSIESVIVVDGKPRNAYED